MGAPGSHRRPVWEAQGRWFRLRQWAVTAAKAIRPRYWTAILVLALLGWPVFREATRNVLVIEPFSVPKELEAEGYAPEVIASRLADQMAEITRGKKARSKEATVWGAVVPSPEVALPDIELLQAKLSLRSLVQFLQVVLGNQPTRISGEITLARSREAAPGEGSKAAGKAAGLEANFRVVTGQKERWSGTVGDSSGDLKATIRRLAEEVLRRVDPYSLAVYQYDPGNSANTLALIRECIDHRSGRFRGRGFHLWGNLLADQGQLEEAVSKYRTAIDFEPTLTSAYIGWGVALDKQNKQDQAIVEYQKAIQLDSKSALAYHNWGVALGKQKKMADAVAKFQKAIQLEPGLAQAHVGLGVSLHFLERKTEAIDEYRRAADLEPEFAVTYRNWGATLESLDRLEEAAAKFQKAVELNPNDASAKKSWERLQEKLRRKQEAGEKRATPP